MAALRRAARELGSPLPSIDVADALLDERRDLGHAPIGGRGDPVSNSAQSIDVRGLAPQKATSQKAPAPQKEAGQGGNDAANLRTRDQEGHWRVPSSRNGR